MPNTTLTPEEIISIARRFTSIAGYVDDFRARHNDALSDANWKVLRLGAETIRKKSDRLIEKAVDIILKESEVSAEQIKNATRDAESFLKTVDDVRKAIKAMGAVIDLGVAILSKDVGGAASAVAKIVGTVTS